MIDPAQIANDDSQRAPGKEFRAREFWRIVRMTRPYRWSLVVGLLFTFLFAAMHTASVGAAFPVFQMLLEEEGLHGWIDRVVAGQRLDVDFAALSDTNSGHLVKVHHKSPLYEKGFRSGNEIRDPQRGPIRDWMINLGDTPNSARVTISARTGGGEWQNVDVKVADVEIKSELLRWAGHVLPPDAPGSQLRTLIGLLAILVTMTILANLCRYGGEVLIAGSVLRTLMDLRDRLYEQTLRLPLAYFSAVETSDVVTRFVQDIQEIQRGLLTLFGKFVREPMRAICLLGLALTLDWRITLVVSLIAPAALGLFWVVGKSVKKANKKLLQQYGHMISALTNSLHNLRVVKTFTAEAQEQKRLDQVDRRMFKQQLKLAKLDAFLSPMMECVGVALGSVLTVWLANLVMHHSLSLAKFGTLGFALAVLFDPLRKMTDVYVRIQRATAGSERIFQVIDAKQEAQIVPGAPEVGPLRRSIEFIDVTFTYPAAIHPALRNVNLSIEQGETLALVGPNGCGKTTLASMLPRLFTPDSGKILYDGVDLQCVALQNLRKQMSVVTQEAVIFGGTPIENIAYGADEVDRDRVEDAARRAFADEFIRNIPGGYEAVLGERGTTLSGGQRQRLAIARAIYRNAPILIFDEATSQIDSESELKIQTALREFSRDRTTIIIAHRLSTIQFADRIVVMETGEVADSGSHRQLFDRSTLYRTLCETQILVEPAA